MLHLAASLGYSLLSALDFLSAHLVQFLCLAVDRIALVEFQWCPRRGFSLLDLVLMPVAFAIAAQLVAACPSALRVPVVIRFS